MTAAELLEAITEVGGELSCIGGELSFQTVNPLPPELLAYIRELKDDLLSLLSEGPQEASGALSDAISSHPIPAADKRIPPYIARCSQCGGARWGPVAPPVPEVLRTGETVTKETWGCLSCFAHQEGTRPPPVPPMPEARPPGVIDSSCPRCDRSDRLLVKGSNIPGEPSEDTLICGACGHCERPAAGPP
jgi:hypothetical protein